MPSSQLAIAASLPSTGLLVRTTGSRGLESCRGRDHLELSARIREQESLAVEAGSVSGQASLLDELVVDEVDEAGQSLGFLARVEQEKRAIDIAGQAIECDRLGTGHDGDLAANDRIGVLVRLDVDRNGNTTFGYGVPVFGKQAYWSQDTNSDGDGDDGGNGDNGGNSDFGHISSLVQSMDLTELPVTAYLTRLAVTSQATGNPAP